MTCTLHTHARHLDTQTLILSRRPSTQHSTPDDIMALLCNFAAVTTPVFAASFAASFAAATTHVFAAFSMPRSRVSSTLVAYTPSPLAVPTRLYTLHLYLSLRSPMLSVSIHGCRRLLLPPPCWLLLALSACISTRSRLCTLSTGHPHARTPLPILPRLLHTQSPRRHV